MRQTTKILVLAAVIFSSTTAAFAQRYYQAGYVPHEQQHWYDRNANY